MDNKQGDGPQLAEEETEQLQVDYRQDSLPMSAGLFEAFLAKEKPGQDAALVYLKLLLTYRRQGTNQPWATNGYLTSGLHMGMDRVKDAKALLHEMGLIEYIQRRESSGKMAKHYTKLNLVSNPGTVGVKTTPAANMGESTAGVKDRPAVDHTSGARQQVLEEEKMLEEKKKGEEPPSAPHGEKGNLHARLQRLTGAESPHFAQAEALLLKGEDVETIVAAWGVMLKERPSKAQWFGADYATHYKPKAKKVTSRAEAPTPRPPEPDTRPPAIPLEEQAAQGNPFARAALEHLKAAKTATAA